jgi:O-antigen/teichoic acid export membrane protein
LPLLALTEPLLAYFGQDFVAGAPVVIVLVLGQLISAAFGPQQHLITMTGHERTGAVIFACSAGLNFVGCMLAVSLLGVTGAAYATVVALIAWNIAMSAFICRRLHLMPGLVATFRTVFMTDGRSGRAI